MPIIIDENGRREVTQQEYNDILAALPELSGEASQFDIEYSMDIPSKSLVIVKVRENDVPFTLTYTEGFQWDDAWINERLSGLTIS